MVRLRPWWQHALGGVVLALFGWWAFVRGTRVPLLGWIDLAIHEFGHLWTMVFPDIVSAAMGSGTQVLVPLLLAGVFLLRERDVLGGALCLGWAATSLQDASVYIGDAPYQRLPLIGGYHDWDRVLGFHLDALDAADELARVVWTCGLLLLLAAAALLAWAGWASWSGGDAGAAAATDEAPEGLPSSWSLPATRRGPRA